MVDALLLYNQRSYDWGDIQPNQTHKVLQDVVFHIHLTCYISEFNSGYNGSENFAKGKRFGFFPVHRLAVAGDRGAIHGTYAQCDK